MGDCGAGKLQHQRAPPAIAGAAREQRGLAAIDRGAVDAGRSRELVDVVGAGDQVAGVEHRQRECGRPQAAVLRHVINKCRHDRHDLRILVVDLLVVPGVEVGEGNDLCDGRSLDDDADAGRRVIARFEISESGYSETG